MDKVPARPRTTQPAVREIVDDAKELIGSAVWPTLGAELIVGNETIVGAAPVSEAAGGAASMVEEAPAGGAGGACPGVRLTVALAQFALYPATVFSGVGLMAKVMPV